MTQRLVVGRLRRKRPATAQQVLDTCRLPLKLIGEGDFRRAYEVVGMNLIIKIPIRPVYGNGSEEKEQKKYLRNVKHSVREYTVWRRIARTKHLQNLRRYLPEIVYFHRQTGIIVVRKYKIIPYNKKNMSLVWALEDEVTRALKTTTADVHMQNVGVDEGGNVRFLDMGCFLTGDDY